jgi:hypothetical protein
LDQANSNASNAATDANTATADAKQEQDNNTVQSLAAAANDFSDLQKLPDLAGMPNLQKYCGLAQQVPGASASLASATTPAHAD